MSRDSSGPDEGSAVVEFTLVAIIVTFVVLSVIQLSLALHIRNTLISAAAEGARVAALPGNGPDVGMDRAAEVLDSALGSIEMDISASESTLDGAPIVTISIAAPVPLVGLWGVGDMHVDARAYVEEHRG